MTTYDLKPIRLPVLRGPALSWFARLLRAPVFGRWLVTKLAKDGGIPKLSRTQLEVAPTFTPLVAPQRVDECGEYFTVAQLENASGMLSARDFSQAYLAGQATPSDVAEAVLEAIFESNAANPALRAIIACQPEDVRRQAAAASERYQKGEPLSALDGVPVAIKDELDMLPYPTTVGTAFLGREPATRDASVVARLRAAGALLIGKANMYELGINPEGHNMHHGVVRNPYDLTRQSGGSSSGPAAAVAAGLCPLAMGADGGGSIRVPAAFCGLVGLKATYGRFSEYGAAPLCWSLAHVGPIGATVEDVVLAYQLAAGPDERDAATLAQPPVTLGDWSSGDLRGVRLGIFRPWFEHAEAEVVSNCDALLEQLQAAGAELRAIEIPDLDLMRIAHAVTILSEIATAMQPHTEHFAKHSPAVQINLMAARSFTSRDYVLAQQVRTLAMRGFAEVLSKVDAIITPSTAVVAPKIPETSAHVGWSDLSTVTEIMRFVVPGNLLGLPAISFPAGYDERGLPIGMQAIAPHWNEALLLRIARAAELGVERRMPQLHYRLLPPQIAGKTNARRK